MEMVWCTYQAHFQIRKLSLLTVEITIFDHIQIASYLLRAKIIWSFGR